MSEREDVLGCDGLRLLDVLLEEECGGVRPANAANERAPRPPSSRWLAAALLLLGIGVVAGIAWMRHACDDAAAAVQQPVQEPVPPPVPEHPIGWNELGDPDRRSQLLQQIARVRVQLLDSSLPQPRPVPGADLVLEDVAQLASLGIGIRDLLGASRGWIGWMEPPPWSSRLVLELSDGRTVEVLLRLHEHPFLVMLPCGEAMPAGDLLTRLRTLEDRARQQAQPHVGTAANLAELQALPPSVQDLSCPWLTAGEVRSELARFVNLRSLTLLSPAQCESVRKTGSQEQRSPPGPDACRAIAELPALQQLSLPATRLDDVALQSLAGNARLRMLALTGKLDGITAAGLAAFGDGLETLRLPDDRVTMALLRAIRDLRHLAELWVALPPEIEAAAECLVAMPSLRRLAVDCGAVADARAVTRAVALSKIEKLRLCGPRVENWGLDQLSQVPTLRELDLRGLRLSAYAPEDLGALQRLRRLELRYSTVDREGVGAIRAALPQCEVIGWGSGDSLEVPLGELPSWSDAANQGAAPTQAPRDLQEWRDRLPRVQRIEARRRIGQKGAGTSVQFVASADEFVTIAAPAAVDRWRTALLASVDVTDPRGTVTDSRQFADGESGIRSLQLRFGLADGSSFAADCLLDPEPRIAFVPADGYLTLPEALRALLLQAFADACRQGRAGQRGGEAPARVPHSGMLGFDQGWPMRSEADVGPGRHFSISR